MPGQRPGERLGIALEAIVNFKAVGAELPGREADGDEIAAVQGPVKVSSGVDDRDRDRVIRVAGVAKKLPQVEPCRSQRSFVGFMAEGQQIGEIHHTRSVGFLEPNAAGVAERHREKASLRWAEPAGREFVSPAVSGYQTEVRRERSGQQQPN